MQLLFATGSQRKVREAQNIFEPLGIEIEAIEPNIHEIQHYDGIEVTKAKAGAAYQKLQRPLFVQDTNWEIPALGGFPGAYMKDVTTWFGPEDWLQLMARHEDKTAICHEHVVYYDGENMQHFTTSFEARFADQARGRGTVSIEQVILLQETNKTIAERLDSGVLDQQGVSLDHLVELAEWYVKVKGEDKDKGA